MNNREIYVNGRVNILGPVGTQLNFSDKIPVKETSSYYDALTGVWHESKLSEAFFSVQNIKLLQDEIIKGVFDKSNKQLQIGQQSVDELKIIMRSIFLQNSNNLQNDIPNQVIELNKLVLEYAINQVYNEAIGYLKYLRSASFMHTLLQNPVNSSISDNTLELKHFFTK